MGLDYVQEVAYTSYGGHKMDNSPVLLAIHSSKAQLLKLAFDERASGFGKRLVVSDLSERVSQKI